MTFVTLIPFYFDTLAIGETGQNVNRDQYLCHIHKIDVPLPANVGNDHSRPRIFVSGASCKEIGFLVLQPLANTVSGPEKLAGDL